MQLTLQDITFARPRIASGVVSTPCPESIPLSELCGARVYCKLEYLQRTGSFKERGARNALLLLNEEQRRRGVIAASAGNHAQALAYHGGLLGIPVTVVMPEFAPLIKRTNCRKLGAQVILAGETFADAKSKAVSIAERDGLMYIHGFDDLAIIAGQGTLGLEVLEQVPDLDAIIVPIGGGGLMAGVALAIKSLRPEVQVIGVEPAEAASFTAALAAGQPVPITPKPTLADGLAIAEVGAHAFEIARAHVDRVVSVSEEHIALAILRLMELEKAVVEGAGAASLAALLSNQLPELAGKRVVIVLCGGNIDLTSLHRLIEFGMVADGRLARFTAQISDRPGGLARLTRLIAESGASIMEVTHDRVFSGLNFAAVNVLCTVETRDAAHIAKLFQLLAQHEIKYTVHHPLPHLSDPE
ncbi:MAG TPA: threonine ammonia-lyase [Pirellulaceae bacterium]|nr:threonine ammonia-lyase [Pirellulaceae bacterium]